MKECEGGDEVLMDERVLAAEARMSVSKEKLRKMDQGDNQGWSQNFGSDERAGCKNSTFNCSCAGQDRICRKKNQKAAWFPSSFPIFLSVS